MAQSFKDAALSYPLTRPFPYKKPFWYLLLLCGIILLTLFTFLAVATNGFEYHPKYITSTDLAAVEGWHEWFQKPPFSWVNSMETICQPTLLVAGARYTTMNRIYMYTLDRLRYKEDDRAPHVPQMDYHNATLEDCRVRQISITLNRQDDSKRSGTYWSWGNTKAGARTRCTIVAPNGLNYTADFVLDLPKVTDVENPSTIISPSQSEHPAIRVGYSIARDWYGQISRAMAYSSPAWDPNESWATGVVTIRRNPDVTDYRSLDYFIANVQQYTQSGTIKHMDGLISHWSNEVSQINATIDAFSKSLWSLLETDFHVGSQSNPLHSREGLMYLASINDTVAANASKACTNKDMCGAGWIKVRDVDNLNFNTTQPTSIFSQYLCAVPKAKETFAIFYAVLLADLVFLHACWAIWATVASWWLHSRDKSANYCAGCARDAADRNDDNIPLISRLGHVAPKRSTSMSMFRSSSTATIPLAQSSTDAGDRSIRSVKTMEEPEMPLLGPGIRSDRNEPRSFDLRGEQ